MIQSKKFINSVYKTDGTNRIIEVGENVTFRLADDTAQIELLTAVGENGRWLSWESSVNGTRKEDVRAVDGAHLLDCTQYGGAAEQGAGDPLSF